MKRVRNKGKALLAGLFFLPVKPIQIKQQGLVPKEENFQIILRGIEQK